MEEAECSGSVLGVVCGERTGETMNELWAIHDRRTGKPVTIARFLSEENAQRKIEEWIRRHHKGGRPDVKLSDLQAMIPVRED